MTDAKPTAILIVHGAYFLPPAWEAFGDRLRKAGFVVQCPRLPSCGDERPPTALREHDVAAVRKASQELIDAGHFILVLAHSYGGMVASEAISRDLYANSGNGVVSLIYLCAWLLQPGDSLEDVITKYGFQTKVDIGNNGDGTIFAKNAPESFYNDLDPEIAEEFAKGNVTHNWATALGPMAGAPWKDLPTTYVHCVQDLAIMLPLQQSMVQDAVNEGGNLITETIDSGHCPFLSQPESIVRIVEAIIAATACADDEKTNTGFTGQGVTVLNVELMHAVVDMTGNRCKVKASGGLQSPEDCVKMLKAGAA